MAKLNSHKNAAHDKIENKDRQNRDRLRNITLLKLYLFCSRPILLKLFMFFHCDNMIIITNTEKGR